MPFIPANKQNTGFQTASDFIIANQNKPTEAPKESVVKQAVDKTSALGGGVVGGLGGDLLLSAMDYAGNKIKNAIPDNMSVPIPFTDKVLYKKTGENTPLTDQFAEATKQTENPNTATAGKVAGFVGGLVTGASEAKAIPVVKKAIETRQAAKTANFVKDLITPALTAKDMATAIKTGKVAESGITGARDVSKALPNFSSIEKAVSEVKGISPKNTLLQNANAIHNEIGSVAETLKSQLKDKGFFSPNEFRGYLNTVKTDLKQNPTLVGDAEKTATKILSKFESLVGEKGYTPSGLLEARKALDIWMKSQKANVFNPNTESAVTTALKSIRQGGNDFLASRVPDVAVKEMLNKQSNLFTAIENIAPKAAKEGGNALVRFTKNYPKLTKAAGIAATAALGGTAAGIVFNK